MFPDDFIFGSNLSDYQHFGGSICDLPLNFTINHKKYFKQDLKFISEIGLTGFRINIEWARIEPYENSIDKEAVKFYHAYFDELKKYNVKTLITLHHFTNPKWVHNYGGFKSEHIKQKFLNYVDFISNEFRENIDYFIIFNEPMLYLYNSYLAGKFPPFHKHNIFGMLKSLQNMINIHAESYDIIKKNSPKAQISSSSAIFSNLDANFILKPIQNICLSLNNLFLNKTIAKSDFIGINYYVSLKNMFTKNYKINPEGLIDITNKLYSKYKKPIIITENGIPTNKNDLKAGYIIKHLRAVENAIENQHIEIKGYFYWSFLHGYEWFNNYSPNFGLINVDLSTMERHPTSAATIFSNIIENKSTKGLIIKENIEYELCKFNDWPFNKSTDPLNSKLRTNKLKIK